MPERFRLFEVTDAGNKLEIRLSSTDTIMDVIKKSNAEAFMLIDSNNTFGEPLSREEVLTRVA